jgi:hypothetical protein
VRTTCANYACANYAAECAGSWGAAGITGRGGEERSRWIAIPAMPTKVLYSLFLSSILEWVSNSHFHPLRRALTRVPP